MKTVGIWCEHSFQVYSALPVIEKYVNTRKVFLFTKQENCGVLGQLIDHKNFNIIGIDQYIYKPAILFKEAFEVLFVDENFSFVYKHGFVEKESVRKRFFRKLFFLKIPAKYLNKVFVNLNSIFFKNKSIDQYFDLDLMITFTKVYYSHLIPDKQKVAHISIMESWDHPMKFPYYISPNYCLTWNKSLAQDTQNIQYLPRVKKIMPLKFKYIYEFKGEDVEKLFKQLVGTVYLDELNTLENKKIVLYPTTTSSSNIMHEGEMELIDNLCSTFEGSDYFLYIKPKPNAPKGDYEVFRKYKNVIIGIYSNNENGMDMLDNNYHIFRYLLLKVSDVVINAGTTFALEAAILNKKIVQLDLGEGDAYSGFSTFCKTYHLKKYIFNLDGVFKFSKNSNQQLLKEIEKNDYTFSNQLRDWVSSW